MAENEFAPVTPGEMLKEEFLTEYGLSQNQLAKAIGISPNRIAEIIGNRRRITAEHRASARLVFRQQSGILDESSDPLRSQSGGEKSQTRRCHTHQIKSRRVNRSIRPGSSSLQCARHRVRLRGDHLEKDACRPRRPAMALLVIANCLQREPVTRCKLRLHQSEPPANRAHIFSALCYLVLRAR
jgi:addiction module HigA family antidote